jgi:hypothetical protein
MRADGGLVDLWRPGQALAGLQCVVTSEMSPAGSSGSPAWREPISGPGAFEKALFVARRRAAIATELNSDRVGTVVSTIRIPQNPAIG